MSGAEADPPGNNLLSNLQPAWVGEVGDRRPRLRSFGGLRGRDALAFDVDVDVDVETPIRRL